MPLRELLMTANHALVPFLWSATTLPRDVSMTPITLRGSTSVLDADLAIKDSLVNGNYKIFLSMFPKSHEILMYVWLKNDAKQCYVFRGRVIVLTVNTIKFLKTNIKTC